MRTIGHLKVSFKAVLRLGQSQVKSMDCPITFWYFFHGQKDRQFFEVKRYHQDILQEKSLFSEVNSDITVYEVNINY